MREESKATLNPADKGIILGVTFERASACALPGKKELFPGISGYKKGLGNASNKELLKRQILHCQFDLLLKCRFHGPFNRETGCPTAENVNSAKPFPAEMN